MSIVTVYMPLLDEGTDVWAPVHAEQVGDRFRVLGPMPTWEQWAFPPGAVVLTEAGKDSSPRIVFPQEWDWRAASVEPPWIARPDIPFGDIGWRMGSGETHWVKFSGFYNSLPEAYKQAFEQEHPEPADWIGFYALKRKYP